MKKTTFRILMIGLVSLATTACGRNKNTLVSDLLKPDPVVVTDYYQNTKRTVVPAAGLAYDIVILLDQSLAPARLQVVRDNLSTFFAGLSTSGLSYQLTLLNSNSVPFGPHPVIYSSDADPNGEAVANVNALIAAPVSLPNALSTDVLLTGISNLETGHYFRTNAYRSFLIFGENPKIFGGWTYSYLRSTLLTLDQQAANLNWTLHVINFDASSSCVAGSDSILTNPNDFYTSDTPAANLSALITFGDGTNQQCAGDADVANFLSQATTSMSNQPTTFVFRDKLKDPTAEGYFYIYENLNLQENGSPANFDTYSDSSRFGFMTINQAAPGTVLDIDLSFYGEKYE